MDKFEPFDLKITKLTGGIWDRTNTEHLLKQLLDEQGNPRHSIENRIIIAFDKSANSSMTFLRKNEAAIIKALLKVALNPYLYTYWLNEYECWGSIILIKEGEYQPSTEYHEHPIGLGMREPGKAEFERHIILEVAEKSGYRIRPNRNPKEIGVDGELKIDVNKLHPIQPVAPRIQEQPSAPIAAQLPLLSKQVFNVRFLLATQCLMPNLAQALIRECREDIEIFGLEYAQRKWAKFINK